jgi:hypothetical protein
VQTGETEFVGGSAGGCRSRRLTARQGDLLRWAAERLQICALRCLTVLLRLECALLRIWLTTQALLWGSTGS